MRAKYEISFEIRYFVILMRIHFLAKILIFELKFHNFYSNEKMVYPWSTWLDERMGEIRFMNSYERHLTYVLTYKQDMFRYENEHSRSNLFKYR